jgi:hypothetical protein
MGLAVVAACHATLAMYLRFKEHPDVAAWLSPDNGAFYKVVCIVSLAEFEKAKETVDHVVMTESMWGNQEIAIAFRPRSPEGWPKSFKFLRLLKKWPEVI